MLLCWNTGGRVSGWCMRYETESIYALYICNVVWCKGILAMKRKNLNKPLVVTSSVIMSVKISVCTSLSSCSSSSSLSSSPTFSSVFLMLGQICMFVEPYLKCVSHQMVQCCVTQEGLVANITQIKKLHTFFMCIITICSSTMFPHWPCTIINKVPQKWIDSLHALC